MKAVDQWQYKIPQSCKITKADKVAFPQIFDKGIRCQLHCLGPGGGPAVSTVGS